MSLTPQQERAAYAKGSVAVIAGAGTGKTHMLAERYLYHLQQQELSPLEVVATTFTEKAATELRSRIRSLVNQKLPQRAYLLAELEAAQISTIHALAMRICREHPEAAGVPPDFTVLDQLEGVLRVERWLDEALDSLPVELYEKIPHSLMSRTLRMLLQDPIAAQKALECGSHKWPELAEELQNKAFQELLQHPHWQQARPTLESYIGKSDDRLEIEARQPALRAIDSIESGQNITESLEVIDKVKINCGSKKNWPEGGLEIVKETIKNLRGLIKDALKDGLINLEFSVIDEQFKTILPALQEAFISVDKYINGQKRRSRVLDFANLEVGALQALRCQEVRAYYALRWQAFLIDEFQDTNPVQSEILQLLTAEKSLTIVGDAKQSIYGFRRADIEVFRGWRDSITKNGGSEEVLTVSFRSHQLLINNINAIFRPLLGDLHQNLDAHRSESPDKYPAIQVHAVEGDENKPQLLRVEADYLAKQFRQMLDEKILICDKKTQELRPVEPKDIAILSRTWAPLEVYGEALESAGIPVALAGGGNLLETREAKDGWALLRFLADPSDDLALVAVLRSPFFAISDRVLFTGIQEVPEERSKYNWWQQLKSSLAPELQKPVEILGQLLDHRTLEPPTRLLQIADNLTGYTAVIANLPNAARREADWQGFFTLVRQLEQGSNDVFAAVRRLNRLIAAEVEIPRLPLSADDAVALMTVHAAKGLEWSVVAVPDLARSGPPSGEPVYFDPIYGVALKFEDDRGEEQKPVIYRCLEYLRKQREETEALRVLYVALTRARDLLILTATERSRGSLSKLQPGLEAAGITINTIPFAPESARPPAPTEPPLPAEPPGLLLNPIGPGLFELPVTALSEYALCPKRFYYNFVQGHPGIGSGIGTAKRLGTLTHLALEKGIRDLGTLARFDMSLPLEDVREALELARRFDELPDFAPFREGEREWKVNFKVGDLTFNGIVDLSGDDWVLDFKTDREIQPEHHRFQLWAYSRATGKLNAYIAYLRHDYLHQFTLEELESTGEEAQTLVQNIVKGDFRPTASEANCSLCPYGDICEERYQGAATKPPEEDMTELIANKIRAYLPAVAELYHRLIIIPCEPGGSTGAEIDFRKLAQITNGGYLNVNLELSRALLELPSGKRPLKVQELLKSLIDKNDNNIYFLEHLEILFDNSLKLEPLKCLQILARDRTIIARWNGTIALDHLTYAESGHPEYLTYPVKDLFILHPEKLQALP